MVGKFLLAPVSAHVSSTVSTTAATITPPGGDCDVLTLQCFDQNIRIVTTGANPTTTTGFQLVAGAPGVEIFLTTGVTVKVIAETGTAKLEYAFSRIVDGAR